MCGLFGSVGFAPDPHRIDMIAHRGPDGRGWEEFTSAQGPVCLGHRRLAIIDTSEHGLQPMADASGRFWLVFNGEIYNYLELRDELIAKGETFRTQTDSEVLLRAYMVWGQDMLPKLRGMFAFLIWDDYAKTLFAARDRFGIKPLYYASSGQGISFGSEIKQLLGLPECAAGLNLARVHDFLASGISDHTAETMFEGVRQIRGGECLSLDLSSSGPLQVFIRRWYDIVEGGGLALSEQEAGERFRALLDDSVRLHLRSDVPIGSCLSGGLDSSSIVCLMSSLLSGQGGQVNTVSACYAEKSVDEKPFMEAVVAATGAKPHYIYPKGEDVFQTASDLTWHQDEPFGSTSIFAQWCVFEEAKRAGIKVMLDGQGADEQLAGYHSSFSTYMASLIRKRAVVMLVRTLIERRMMHGLSVRSQAQRFLVPLLPGALASRLRERHRALAQHNWLGGEAYQALGPLPSAFQTALDSLNLKPANDIAALCVALTYASNLQMLLHWEDRNSMAHSIEARVPFLDHPLVEFSLKLGNEHKIVGGDTKRVLRTAMKGILPEPVRQRRDKLGFSTPEEAWFRGPLRNQMRDGVEATLKRFPSLFNVQGTRAFANEVLNGERPVDFTLWRIVNLGLWGERFGLGA